MNNIEKRDTVSKRILFNLILVFGLIFVVCQLGESGARLRGIKPWTPDTMDMSVEPGGGFYAPHPTLGYSNLPGKFVITQHNGTYTWRATHLDSTLRITRPLETYGEGQPAKDEIWIFGCSWVYGWALNDHETLPWTLQERLRDYEIVNFGAGAYGTIHSLIQFREALERGEKPRVAVLTYAWFHNERNTYIRMWRKETAPYNELGSVLFPSARIDGSGALRYKMVEVEYAEFPFMRSSALMHAIEMFYNRNVEYHLSKTEAVTKALIREFYNLCRKEDIGFVLAGLDDYYKTVEVLNHFGRMGVPAVDISIEDFDDGYRNLPYDPHPNAGAQEIFAGKLESFLKDSMFDKN